jgi:hypothetical protein
MPFTSSLSELYESNTRGYENFQNYNYFIEMSPNLIITYTMVYSLWLRH